MFGIGEHYKFYNKWTELVGKHLCMMSPGVARDMMGDDDDDDDKFVSTWSLLLIVSDSLCLYHKHQKKCKRLKLMSRKIMNFVIIMKIYVSAHDSVIAACIISVTMVTVNFIVMTCIFLCPYELVRSSVSFCDSLCPLLCPNTLHAADNMSTTHFKKISKMLYNYCWVSSWLLYLKSPWEMHSNKCKRVYNSIYNWT